MTVPSRAGVLLAAFRGLLLASPVPLPELDSRSRRTEAGGLVEGDLGGCAFVDIRVLALKKSMVSSVVYAVWSAVGEFFIDNKPLYRQHLKLVGKLRAG